MSVSGHATHAKGSADLQGTRAGVPSQQDASDRSVEFVMSARIGVGQSDVHLRAPPLHLVVTHRLAPLRAVPVPMRAAAVPALCETGVPCTGRGFALPFARVSRRIRALRSVALRRSGLDTFCLIATFRYMNALPCGLSSSMLRLTSRASQSLRTSRIVVSVSARSPVAPFITSFTSRI
eukprot:5100147-Pleurochrysis_carterae.AAC.1